MSYIKQIIVAVVNNDTLVSTYKCMNIYVIITGFSLMQILNDDATWANQNDPYIRSWTYLT